MGRVVEQPLDRQLHHAVRVPVGVQAIHQVRRVADPVPGKQLQRVDRELPRRRAVAAHLGPEPLQDRLRLAELLLFLDSPERRRRPVRVAVRPELVPGGDDVAHAIGMHLGDAARDEERRWKPAPVKQPQDLRDADVRAVGTHREQPRLGRCVRVARKPDLLGVEVKGECDGAAGARRPGHCATATAGRSIVRFLTPQGYGLLPPPSSTEASAQPLASPYMN